MGLKKPKLFRILFILGFIVVSTLSFVPVAYCGEERVQIVAEDFGSYDFNNNVFKAQGNVVITSEDFILKSDELWVNLSTSEAELKGNVSLIQGEQEVTGRFLSYNLETGEGNFEEARTEILLADETGTLFVFGNAVELDDESYTVEKATFTTCELENSHYHIATKKIEVILGKRVIIKGVTYYEGKIPIFYWPYLVIPLDTMDEDRFFNLPVVGYGEYEGYYMLNTFNYYFNENSYGNIHLDGYSNLGVAIGAKHNYDLKKLGKGSLHLHGLPGYADILSKKAWNHELKISNLTLKTNTSEENSWMRQEFTTKNSVALNLPRLKTELWYNYKLTPRLLVHRLEEYGGLWSQNLTKDWKLDLRGSFTERETTQTLRLIDYLGETTYVKDKHKFTLAVQQQVNPDLLESEVQPWRSIQRIPEFKWENSDFGAKKSPFRSQLAVGRYQERPVLTKQSRVFGQLSLKSQTWRPFDKTRVTYQGDLSTSYYGDRKQQTWTYGRVSVSQELVKGLRLTNTYRRRDVWGFTPFRFDQQKPLQDLGFELSYTNSKLRTSVNSRYDFLSEGFSPLIFRANWKATKSLSFDLYGYHDLNTKETLTLVPMVDYKTEDVGFKLGLRYHPTTKTVERIDSRISVPVGKTWRVGYESIFEPLNQEFIQGHVTLTRDLHCRTLELNYDHVEKRVALQYTINAFPNMPIGWDSKEGMSLFDLDEVTDIIGGIE